MARAYSSFNQRVIPQSESIPGKPMIPNAAGGHVFALDDWKAFERFLILGSEGGTYYIGEAKLTREAALRTIACIAQDGRRAVDTIVEISDSGRAPKNDPAIFALALAASAPDVATRQMALAALPKVCRIPTHLFHFLEYTKGQRGWGRTLKRAVAAWYNDKPTEFLAYQLVKYQQRDGWANADVLRKSHPHTTDRDRNAIYRWVVDGYDEAHRIGLRNNPEFGIVLPSVVQAFEAAKEETNIQVLVDLIRNNNLSREMLPTEALTKPEVWEALLERMPPEAMLRNLGNMSKVGLLKPLSTASRDVVRTFQDQYLLRKARLHPIAVLIAMKVYASGRGLKGKGEWTPVPAVIDALNDAFYLCFKNIEPTGKRLLFAVDVSGSMSSSIIGNCCLTAAEGAAAMALACAKSEKDYYIMGFSAVPSQASRYGGWYDRSQSLDGFIDLGITPSMRLDDAVNRTRNMTFGATDCALPWLWASLNNIEVDACITITDNETWAGSVHPTQALRAYREKTGIRAKNIVMGMTATNFTINDPTDPDGLDVVGMDASVPAVIQEFIRG